MKHLSLLPLIVIMSIMISSCCSTKKAAEVQKGTQVSLPGPKAIIYQTTKDYSMLVPVILSEDKKSIVSYPDVKDVYYDGKLAYPTQLNKGYLLDNRGINKNVAFLNLSYEAYSKLGTTPTPDQIMKMIADDDPLQIMYSCGIKSSYKNIEQELNSKIDADDFSAFVRLK